MKKIVVTNNQMFCLYIFFYSLKNLELWIVIVLIKMADYDLILGSYIRFAFAFSSTFVTSPSYIAIFSFAIKTINKAFWISDQMISIGALGWNNSERFITICNIQIQGFYSFFSAILFYFLKSSGLWLCWFFWNTIWSPLVLIEALQRALRLLHLQLNSPFFIGREFENL